MSLMGSALAQSSRTLEGYLVDIACVNERHEEGSGLGPKHSKGCLTMPECEKSGYAVMVGDKVYKFDAKGNALAKKLIAATEKDRDWKVAVSGRVKADTVAVRTLKLK